MYHPGQIDLNDDKTIAAKLFGLVNIIVELQITQAKHIEDMFDAVRSRHRQSPDRETRRT